MRLELVCPGFNKYETMIKNILRKLCSPLLSPLEAGEGDYNYKPSHRIALIALGALFLGLASLVAWFAVGQDPGYFLPVLVFGAVAVVSLIVGLLGTDRAVSRIWRSARG